MFGFFVLEQFHFLFTSYTRLMLCCLYVYLHVAFGFPRVVPYSVCHVGSVATMAFERANTARSMMSRQWTTSAMFDGLAHVLGDSAAELPDDLESLEAITFFSILSGHTLVMLMFRNEL